VWKLTKGQYYGVPVLRDGRKVTFESADDSQDVARYLDRKFRLDLFPAALDGIQDVLCRRAGRGWRRGIGAWTNSP
jgi:hypothetical protein